MGLSEQEKNWIMEIEKKIDTVLGNGLKFDGSVLDDFKKDLKALKTKTTKIDNKLNKLIDKLKK